MPAYADLTVHPAAAVGFEKAAQARVKTVHLFTGAGFAVDVELDLPQAQPVTDRRRQLHPFHKDVRSPRVPGKIHPQGRRHLVPVFTGQQRDAALALAAAIALQAGQVRHVDLIDLDHGLAARPMNGQAQHAPVRRIGGI